MTVANKMKKQLQSGFAHLMFLLLLAAVLAVGVASYKIVKDRQVKTSANLTSTTLSSNATKPIKNTTDLNNASNDLSNQSVDADLNPDQLDSDVSALL